MGGKFNFIFLGLTHGFMDDFKKQKQLIDKINPEFILSEEIENTSLKTKSQYETFLKNKSHSLMTSFEDVERLVNLCYNKNIKLIGIDLENFGFSEELANKINHNKEISESEELEIDNIVSKREAYQLEKIKEYSNASEKPILVFLGSWHIREGSPILKEISKSKIIFPANKGGNLVLEPIKEEIIYSEKNND